MPELRLLPFLRASKWVFGSHLAMDSEHLSVHHDNGWLIHDFHLLYRHELVGHKVTLRGATTLKHCPDCESEHIGLVPCGRTFRGRLRSVRLDASVTPTRTKRLWYDDEPLKETFGYDRKDRREIYADETKGQGAITGRATKDHVDAVLGKESD